MERESQDKILQGLNMLKESGDVTENLREINLVSLYVI